MLAGPARSMMAADFPPLGEPVARPAIGSTLRSIGSHVAAERADEIPANLGTAVISLAAMPPSAARTNGPPAPGRASGAKGYGPRRR